MTAVQKRLRRFLAWCGRAPEQRHLAIEALSIPRPQWEQWAAARPEACNFHTVNAVLAHGRRHLADEPREALAATTLALILACAPRGWHGEGRRMYIHPRALIEHGHALHLLGDFPNALRAIETACRALVIDTVSRVTLAEAKCVEALVRHRLGQAEGTLRIIETALDVLHLHGETAAAAKCHLVEGTIHFEHARFDRSARAFEAASASAVLVGDDATDATASVHLGHCALELGDRASANRLYLRALDLFGRNGAVIGRKQAAWGMARLLATEGKFDVAIRGLDLVVQEMSAAGLVVEAALARGEMFDALLGAGRDAEAAAIAHAVMDTLMTFGMFREANPALAFLRERDPRFATASRRNRGNDS